LSRPARTITAAPAGNQWVSRNPIASFKSRHVALTSREALLKDLDKIRERGFAIDDGEHEAEVRCSAAPILNHLKEPIASFSVSGPKWRLSDEKLEEIGKMVHDTALEISNRLGFQVGCGT
jgi:DNA-binding IclR family transcriptional regulator